MKDILDLTKILLKNNFRLSDTKKVKKKIILYVCVYLYLAGVVGFLSFEILDSLKIINQEQIFIKLCFIFLIIFSLFRTILSSLNVLFFSKDTEYLLPLPINPKNILAAKINVLLVYEYITEMFIGLIPMVIYGYLLNQGIVYYVYMIIILALLPILPIMIAVLLDLVIMRFTNLLKNKDVVHYLSIILVLIIVFVTQIFTSSMGENVEKKEVAEMITNYASSLNNFPNTFITVSSAENAIFNINSVKGLENLILYVLENIIIYVLIVEIVSKIYLKGLVGVTAGAGKKIRKNKKEKFNIKENNVMISYIKKEFKILKRNPVYFIQCLLPSLIFPIIFITPFIININNLSSLDMAEIDELKVLVNTPIGVAVTICAALFFFMTNFISITAVSRDGNNANFMKYIPISFYKQCIYKTIPCMIMNMISILYIIIVLEFILKMDLVLIIITTFVLILINIFESLLMILPDLINPKLEWTTEYTVVKQNINMIYQMIFDILIGILTIVIGNCFKNNIITFSILIILTLLGITLTYLLLKKKENNLSKKII